MYSAIKPRRRTIQSVPFIDWAWQLFIGHPSQQQNPLRTDTCTSWSPLDRHVDLLPSTNRSPIFWIHLVLKVQKNKSASVSDELRELLLGGLHVLQRIVFITMTPLLHQDLNCSLVASCILDHLPPNNLFRDPITRSHCPATDLDLCRQLCIPKLLFQQRHRENQMNL